MSTCLVRFPWFMAPSAGCNHYIPSMPKLHRPRMRSEQRLIPCHEKQTVNEKEGRFLMCLLKLKGLHSILKRFPNALLQRSRDHFCDVLSQHQRPELTFTNGGIEKDGSKINRADPGPLTTAELLLATLSVALTTPCHRVSVTVPLCLGFAHLYSPLPLSQSLQRKVSCTRK